MTAKSTQSKLMLFIVFCAFISIGFPDAVLGTAWPEMRLDFGRNLSELGFILLGNSTGYFISGALAGTLLDRFGVGKTLAFSTLLVALGLTGYAVSPSFWLLPFIAVCVGFGSGAVDAGLNFYAAEKYSNKVMSWLHAFFGIGAMIGPFIMAAALKAGDSWRLGYAIVAGVTFVLAAIFILRMNGWDEINQADGENPRIKLGAVLRMPLVWLQIGLFFGMVGIEASVGAWSASILTDRFGESAANAGLWVGIYWGATALARIMIPVLFKNMPTAIVIKYGTWGMLIAGLMMIPDNPLLFKCSIILFGFGSAPMFPNLMTLTPHRFGREVSLHTIGLQVSAATAAGFVIPGLAGVISDATSIIAIPVIISIVAVIVVLLESQLRGRTGFADTVH